MITIPAPEASLEVVLSRGAAEFAYDDLARVAAGVDVEDMVPVTIEGLHQSYSCMGAYALNGADRELVGFARQLRRDDVLVDEERVCVTELGTLWVSPERRGQGIGETLLTHATNLMTVVGFLPVAVCNEDSRKLFERVGYEPVASMWSRAGRHRIVEVYPNGPQTGPAMNSRQAAITRLNELDRFRHMDLLA